MQAVWSTPGQFTLSGLLRWTMQFILRHPLIFWTCVVANTIGVVYGTIWWYGPMLQRSPLWAYAFIPDCPLAALVANIALLGLYTSRYWPTFNALVAFACMKYGTWTVLFWLRQWTSSGEIYPIEVMLFVTHIGLFIEGLLFVPYIGPLSLPKRLAVIGWFALSIFIDYGLGYHPPLASHVSVTFLFWVATIMTALLSVGLLLLPYHTEHEASRATLAHERLAVK